MLSPNVCLSLFRCHPGTPRPSRFPFVGLACSLVFVVVSIPASAVGADVGLRVFHPHELSNLLAAPAGVYAKTSEAAGVFQFNPTRYPRESGMVRRVFPRALLTEEFIIGEDCLKIDEATFDPLVEMIAAGEATGWEWGDLIVYREPLFQAIVPRQKLLPGPWNDRRLVSPRDIQMLRARLGRARREGKIKRDKYRICGLLYSWLNVGGPEKRFIEESLDGVYVEMNSRGGKWSVDGNPTTLRDPFKNPGHDFVAFGLPGTRDTAAMAGWCLEAGKRFGITAGANVTDVWFRNMFEDYLLRGREAGVDTASSRITYLLHHNREANDGGLLYFPETKPDSMTNLILYIERAVGSRGAFPKPISAGARP